MVIRKALLQDAAAIAGHLLSAMGDIVYKFIGTNDPIKAIAFMRYFAEKELNQYSYQNCWVAERDGGIIAAANIYDGADLKKLRQPVLDYIKITLDNDIIPEDETEAGEIYIDTIAVHPSYRGQGIGTQFLISLIDKYVNTQRNTLGLLVDEENVDAKRFYERLGFHQVGRKLLLSRMMEHFQISTI